ncbi:hypothetical protein OG735_20115 [Streptomyces sp. NBC_01210]|uniref:hypothetical protein n=1 Tax=Streptomyces sp. NBC_01210 TaxID=2903774 RepID=UPI002E15B250|nr:hypothetical protein OG735_20115 [Streptomyces sp. NBC_01210]
MKSRIATTPTSLALIALALTACGSSTQPGAGDKPAVTPSTPTTKDPAQEFLDWADKGGSATLDAIATDLAAVDKASEPVDLAGLRESCSTLTADLEVAQKADPMPDPKTAQRWQLALEHLTASAAACTEGAISEDQAAFDLMASEMDIGIKHLAAVNKHLASLNG